MNMFFVVAIILVVVSLWLSNKKYESNEKKESGWRWSMILFIVAAIFISLSGG
jgi:uncharacterized membrane protein YtjA (UPF0391 family)